MLSWPVACHFPLGRGRSQHTKSRLGVIEITSLAGTMISPANASGDEWYAANRGNSAGLAA